MILNARIVSRMVQPMQGALTSFADVTEQDVEYRLFTLKPSTAPGPDGLLPGFLKTMAAILAPSLSRIFSSFPP